jgi:hypothetical protein
MLVQQTELVRRGGSATDALVCTDRYAGRDIDAHSLERANVHVRRWLSALDGIG